MDRMVMLIVLKYTYILKKYVFQCPKSEISLKICLFNEKNVVKFKNLGLFPIDNIDNFHKPCVVNIFKKVKYQGYKRAVSGATN